MTDYLPRECYTEGRILKRRYTKKGAKLAARRMGQKVTYYKCSVCGRYHLGHLPESPRVAP